MRIVIDTNVVASGVFFGGQPRRVLEAVVQNRVQAFATPEIIDEYTAVVDEMIEQKQGSLNVNGLAFFLGSITVDEPKASVEVCRDKDDDKFIGCALDAQAIYIVSGDKDLLSIGQYHGVEMITAMEFCRRHLA